tara:strand:- start:30210 stop:32477 length:2268 start_codon:yes stop_codon:yes gene_type:complete
MPPRRNQRDFLFYIMSKISLFPQGEVSKKTGKLSPAAIPFTNIEFDEYLGKIRDGEFQDEVLAYRSGRIEKLKLRGVTSSGVFSYRSAKSLTQHSGFISIDIDKKDQSESLSFTSLKDALSSDPYTYAMHHSAGGYGLVVYIKIVPEKHFDSFQAIEKYYADNYNVIIDASCKDVSRFRFVSYDPDLYQNKKSRTWKKYIPKKAKEPKQTYIYSSSDLDHVFQQISDTGVDLTNDYHDWYRIGCGLFHKYGESGRDFFHLVSQNSKKYEGKACDDLFNIISKRTPDKTVTIGTFLWLASNAGIEIKTKRTQHIERVAKTRRKAVGTSGGAKDVKAAKTETVKYLKEIDDIGGSDVDEIVDQVMALTEKDLNEKSNDLIADLELFLKTYDLKFNEITRNYELDGEPMIDRDYNSIYIKSKKQVDEKISKDLLFSLIDSEHTESYHPFKEFFSKYKNLKPEGNMEKLCECFKYNQVAYTDDGQKHKIDDYLETFLKKWMLGVIASMHGTYSILVLVLTGGQRAGKTKFFRNLLPDELMEFYAESKLDDGKDSEILMTKKLIILDDEFGGKSKQDAKRLKELSSKQWFNLRRPFGRTSEDLRRLAVLCGTSNDEEVINDPTGNRRIIPVNVIDIDHDKMAEINKVDLFMELYNEWREMGDDWMLSKEDIEILNMCTQMNEQPSIEEELVLKYFTPAETLGGGAMALSNSEIKLFIESKNPTIRINHYKLGLTLKKLGYEKSRMRVDGNVKLCYLLNEL